MSHVWQFISSLDATKLAVTLLNIFGRAAMLIIVVAIGVWNVIGALKVLRYLSGL